MKLNIRTHRRVRLSAALVALSSLAAILTGTQQAAAAPEDGRFEKVDHSAFVLYPREIPGVDPGQLGDQTARSVIEGAEATKAVTRASVPSIAQSRQHTGRNLCHTTGINGTYKYNGFCWDKTDDATSAYNDAGGWHPQGLTASHDAEASGTVGGRHLYMQAWYYGHGNGATDRDKKARVSILESTGKDWSYGHVLLVRPQGSRTDPGFQAVDNVHADGMAWYGNRLFVANGGELQIYDLNHLWKVNSLSPEVGIKGGVSSAGHHQWALPMVARYGYQTKAQETAWEQAHPGRKAVRACEGLIACLSSLSVDRSSGSLVSGEYRSNSTEKVFEHKEEEIDTRPARVITWPLASIGEGGTAPVTATSAHVAPVRQLQGVATDGTYYYLSAECPVGYMGDPRPGDALSYSCVYQARPGERASVLTRAPALTQNLSYAPSSGRLWGSNEQTNHRVVFSLLPRRADSAVYLSNDYSALCAGAGNKITNGSKVIQWGCTNAQDERWVFEDTTDADGKRAYFLQNAYSGKCMGPASSLADGAGMVQYTCNGAVDEKWWYDPGTHELRNVYSGKCLGLGSHATKGSQLIQWTCNGAPDEKWSKTAR
ncbi:RICIN domain-containing protein [Streptomyces sp. NPDC051907]|uniref:RICIN domain-containing protein n=1 Tax=Streptomyces sp. NPDC051907 TaxID=3155284 RepID=UPI00344AEFE2